MAKTGAHLPGLFLVVIFLSQEELYALLISLHHHLHRVLDLDRDRGDENFMLLQNGNVFMCV